MKIIRNNKLQQQLNRASVASAGASVTISSSSALVNSFKSLTPLDYEVSAPYGLTTKQRIEFSSFLMEQGRKRFSGDGKLMLSTILEEEAYKKREETLKDKAVEDEKRPAAKVAVKAAAPVKVADKKEESDSSSSDYSDSDDENKPVAKAAPAKVDTRST